MAEITLERARRIIDAALEYGARHALKPLSVIVLDAGGNCRAFARSDGAWPGRFAIAEGKAYGAVMLGLPSSRLKQRAESEPYFISAASGALQGRLIPVAGGVLVRDHDGSVLGAVGITGDTSENDAAAAVAGIEAVGLVAEA